MKKLITKIAAVSAVAITALSSAGMTAFAYDVTSSNMYNLNCTQTCNGRGYVWSTPTEQNGLPVFGAEDLTRNVTPRILYGSSGYIAGTLNKNFATVNDLANVKKYVDRLSFTDKNGNFYSAHLEFDSVAENNKFAVRMMDNTYTGGVLSHFAVDEETFKFNKFTGEYSGKLFLDGYYVSGLKVESCGDGMTKFGEPYIIYDREWDMIRTVIEFKGSYTYSNYLFFNKDEVQFNILRKINFTYNDGSYTLDRVLYKDNDNALMKSFNDTETFYPQSNSTYKGICIGSDLPEKIDSGNKARFLNNQFVGVKTDGSVLYICFGKNSGTVPSTSTLRSLLLAGGRETIVFNNWIRKNAAKYSKVVINYKATSASIGTSLRTFTNTSTFLDDIDAIYWGRKS